ANVEDTDGQRHRWLRERLSRFKQNLVELRQSGARHFDNPGQTRRQACLPVVREPSAPKVEALYSLAGGVLDSPTPLQNRLDQVPPGVDTNEAACHMDVDTKWLLARDH